MFARLFDGNIFSSIVLLVLTFALWMGWLKLSGMGKPPYYFLLVERIDRSSATISGQTYWLDEGLPPFGPGMNVQPKNRTEVEPLPGFPHHEWVEPYQGSYAKRAFWVFDEFEVLEPGDVAEVVIDYDGGLRDIRPANERAQLFLYLL